MPDPNFAELRSLLQQTPASSVWEAITEQLDAHPDDELLRDHILPYVASSLRRWPYQLVEPPARWLEILLSGGDDQRLSTLRSLTLHHASHGHLVHKGLAAIARSPHLTQLRALTLSSVPISEHSAALLASSPTLASLRHVHIKAHKLSAEALSHLCGARWLSQLESLSIEYATIDDEHAQRLIEHLDAAPLAQLNLDSSRTPASLAALLAQSSLPKTLQTLRLSGAELHPEGALTLAHTPFERLRALHIAGGRIQDQGLSSLLDAPWITQINQLDLAYNKLTWRSARQLAQSDSLPGLRELSLYGNQIGDDGAIALAQSSRLSQLHALRLELNDITRRGGQALATSQTLPQDVRDHWRALHP